jgi:protein O-GlcNAc transferase
MPTIPEALAIALEHHRAGRMRESEAIYRQILAADPNQPDAWHLLGLIASQVGRHQDGVECIQRALRLRPDWAEAHFNLGNAWKDQGKLDQAIACYQRALQLKPDYAEMHNNLGLAWRDHGALDQAVTSHDHENFEIYCYADVTRPDEITARLRSLADVWQNIGGLFDEQVARLVRQDGIDILVDLTMHMARNRLLVFARKPAPVQV